MENRRNVPHEARFEGIPDLASTQRFVYKNILLDKMTARDFEQNPKGKTKTCNLDYHPNYNFVKAKNTYGPTFEHYLDPKRSASESLEFFGGSRMMPNDRFSGAPAPVNSKITTNFDKMIGRDELRGSSRGLTSAPTDLGSLGLREPGSHSGKDGARLRKFKIQSSYMRKDPHHMLDVNAIIQDAM
jgi:hypothetical protein